MSKIVFNELDSTPSAQPEGATMLYSKTDGYLYAKNGATAERPLDKPIDVTKQGTVLIDVVDDPHWDNIKVLLHCDEMVSENSDAPIDLAPREMWSHITGSTEAFVGNYWSSSATVDTTIKKYGAGSFYFNGSSSYMWKPTQFQEDDFLENNFTIEAWVYVTGNGSGSYKNILRTYRNVSSVNRGFYLHAGNGTGSDALKPGMFCSFTGGDGHVESPDSISLNTWTHIATVRDGGTIRLYVDGVQKASSICSGTYRYDNSSDYYIGTAGNAAHGTNTASAQYFQGNLDDIRVTNGICRYPSGTTFTPPTKALPYVTKKLTTIVTDTSGYNASQPGWSTSDGDNTTVYTTSLGAKVGVGTTSPSYRLEVDGGIKFQGKATDDGLRFDCAGSTDYIIREAADDVIQFGPTAVNGFTHNFSSGALTAKSTAKAWVNFDGSSPNSGGDTISIASSYNTSSITDVAWGKYTWTFGTEFPNTDYCVVGSAGTNDSTGAGGRFVMIGNSYNNHSARSTTAVDIVVIYPANTPYDADDIQLVAFGN